MVTGMDIVNKAKGSLGVKYVWGGNSLSAGVDCSGLVQQVFKTFGIFVPRVTYEQIGQGASVGANKLQPGDLVFFDTDRARKGPDHVGIYIGGGKFIHAPHTGDVVKISSLTDSYYMGRFMGGRRIAGVANSSSFAGGGNALRATGINPNTFSGGGDKVHQTRAELAETYGMSKAFFDSIPELKGLFNKAVSGTWTPARFTAELKNTKWWKETTSTKRQAEITAKTDPATYKANLSAAQAAAGTAAVQMGAILSTKALQGLAKNIVTYGWNDAQIQNFLGKYVNFNAKHVIGGQAGQIYDSLRKTAYDNGISLSDQSVKNSAAYVSRGISTLEKEQAQVRAQSATAYPAFAKQIMAGANMIDLAQPYIQMVSNELQVPITDVDLYNAKVRAALQRKDDKGNPAPMSLTDFQVALRDDPAWRKTSNAAASVMAIGHQVASDMGLAAGGQL
jgi:hypothetical protein